MSISRRLLVILGLFLSVLGTAVGVQARTESEFGAVEVNQRNCESQSLTRDEMQNLANMINKLSVTDAAEKCLETLSDKSLAEIFNVMAELLGVEFDEKSVENKREIGVGAIGTRGADWQQPIQGTIFTNWWTSTGPYDYDDSQYFCDADPDVDKVVKFSMNPPITDPDAARVWSAPGAWQWNVATMISYYTVRYGGINGSGNTGNSLAKLCIGNGQWIVAGSWIGVSTSLRLQR